MFLTDAFVWDIYAFSLKLRAKPFKIDEDFEFGKTVVELLQKRQDGSHKARSQMDGVSSRYCYFGERSALREVLVKKMKSTRHSRRQGCITWLAALEKIVVPCPGDWYTKTRR